MEQNTAAADLRRPEKSILYVWKGTEWLDLSDNIADFSLEFLMGRALDNAMLNVGLKDVARGMNSTNRQPLASYS